MNKPAARRGRNNARERQVFYRWFWLVYVPWLLGAFGIVVFASGILPSQGRLLLLGLLAWNALGVGLLVLRRRRGVSVPVPRTLVTGLAWLGALGIGGFVLVWMGINRMTTSGGPTLMVVGAFFMFLAGVVPVFKLADVALRKLSRALMPPGHPACRPQRASQPRRAA